MADVFTDITAHRVYVAELSPYDPSTGAVVTKYVATAGFVTGPAETPANTYFEGRLTRDLTFRRSMFKPGQLGGRSLPDMGDLRVMNMGEIDDWRNLHWDGRAVVIKAGLKGSAYADFQIIFDGVSGSLVSAKDGYVLDLRDKQSLLDKLLQDTLYAGTGGNEGGDDLKDKPKPVAFGECLNITPVRVDSSSNVYDVHDGQIEAVTAVYDNGKLLTLTTNYTVDLVNGRITLTASPTGLITADIKGSKTSGAYVSTVADIVERLVTDFGGLVPADLDAASFTALNSAAPAAIGYYSRTAATGLLDLLDDICDTVGAFYTFNRAGLLMVGQVVEPAVTADFEIDTADMLDNSLNVVSFGPVHWRRRIDYGRAWTVQLSDVLDATATDAYKDFVGEEYRRVSASDADIKLDGVGKGGQPNALDPNPRPGLLVDKTEAETEVARQFDLYKVARDVVGVVVKTQVLAHDLGETCRVSHSRFGLSTGQNFLVVELVEHIAQSEVELTMWG